MMKLINQMFLAYLALISQLAAAAPQSHKCEIHFVFMCSYVQIKVKVFTWRFSVEVSDPT